MSLSVKLLNPKARVVARPHVVSFMDQMLHADDGLRVEEVHAPSHLQPTPLIKLIPKSRDYMLMALQHQGTWVFNPGDEYLIKAGNTLVVMANPGGCAGAARAKDDGRQVSV